MRIPRVFLALLLVFACVPLTGAAEASSEEEAPQLAVATAPRDADETASRGAERTPEGVAASEPTPTTAAPTTTATPTTTAAPKPKPKPAPAPEPEPAKAEVKASGSVNAQAAQIAQAQAGKAYRSGAVGPNAFDCSGLIIYSYKQAGVDMPRLTSEGFGKYTKVSRDQLQPGDVVYKPGHVGMYIGGGKMVHASTPRGGVKISPIDAPGKPTAFYRI